MKGIIFLSPTDFRTLPSKLSSAVFSWKLQIAPIGAHEHGKMADIPFGFIAQKEKDNPSNIGADSPISLSSARRQVSFRGISDQRLKRLLNYYEPSVLFVIKLVLSSGFLSNEEFPRDNTAITSRFVASLLDNQVPKLKINALSRHLFNPEDLLGLELVLNRAILGVGMPRPKDLILFSIPGEVIAYHPFLLDLSGAALSRHRAFIAMAFRFLEWRLLGVEPEGTDREEELRDFARINGLLPMKTKLRGG